MLSERVPPVRGDRRRFAWALFASAALNVAAWVSLPAYLAALRGETHIRETIRVSASAVRIERRAKPARAHPSSAPRSTAKPIVRPKPRRAAVASPPPVPAGAGMAPPQPASLALPQSWSKQDFGFLETTDATEWIDWKHQSARWVPRVFLWTWKVHGGYMSRPTLQDGVKQILSSLHAENAKVYVSKAENVCDGRRAGWYLSYVKTADDPPLRFDETLYLDGETIYRAMYLRAADQPEDEHTRKALDTLCRP